MYRRKSKKKNKLKIRKTSSSLPFLAHLGGGQETIFHLRVASVGILVTNVINLNILLSIKASRSCTHSRQGSIITSPISAGYMVVSKLYIYFTFYVECSPNGHGMDLTDLSYQ